MATHFICQSTEPLPHNYQTGPPAKSHGAVSQYEVFNAGRKAHTKFPPPGWDFSQTSEEDSLPLIHPAPEPEQKSTSFVYDTDLCVTPQRPKSSSVRRDTPDYDDNIFRKPDANPDPGLELTPMKPCDDDIKSHPDVEKGRKQKVRFEIDDSLAELNSSDKILNKKSSPVKAYQPELYEDDDCDFEIEKLTNISEESSGNKSDFARTVKYNVSDSSTCKQPSSKSQGEMDNNRAFDGAVNSKNSQDKRTKSSTQSIPKTQLQKTVKVVREKNDKSQAPASQGSDKVDHIASCWVHESTGTKRKAKVFRDNQYTPGDTEYTYPFKDVS